MYFTKTCSVCQEQLPATKKYFHIKKTGKYGLASKCKTCINLYKKEQYKKHKEKILNKVNQYYQKNKINILKKQKQYLFKNKLQHQIRTKNWYIKNKEYVLSHNKKYRKKNKEKIKQQKSKYIINRYNTDYAFKMKMNLSKRMRDVISKNGVKTVELIGCSTDFLKTYLESKFTKGMNWDYYGRNGWHIDHIIPCASFDLSDPEQQKKCFHYSNLQPLWAEDNLRKSDKIL